MYNLTREYNDFKLDRCLYITSEVTKLVIAANEDAAKFAKA